MRNKKHLTVPLIGLGPSLRWDDVEFEVTQPGLAYIMKAMPEDSIFTKIIKGEIPCEKVYEDEKTMAFLDIYPVQPGHVLVIPKRQVEFVWDLEDEDYQAVMATAQKVALRIRTVLGTPYVSSRVVGVDVPHAHVHLIPFSATAELRHEPDHSIEPDHTALAEMAKKLAF